MDAKDRDLFDESMFEPAIGKQRDMNRVPRMKAKSQRRANQRKRKATADRGISARRLRRY